MVNGSNRMDRTRGRTAAQLLATISETDLRQALHELADEPEARRIAAAIVAASQRNPFRETGDLARLIMETIHGQDKNQGRRLHPAQNRWHIHPAARTFQALRILVNRELAPPG